MSIKNESAVVRQLARRFGRMVVWWGTSLEARSSLVRLLREDALDQDGLAQARDRLSLLARRWSEMLPTDGVRSVAEVLLDRHPLRAADALQLGAALEWCGGRPRERAFICLDERLAQAAAAEGFAAFPVPSAK